MSKDSVKRRFRIYFFYGATNVVSVGQNFVLNEECIEVIESADYDKLEAECEALKLVVQAVAAWRDCCASQDDSQQGNLRRKMFRLLNDYEALKAPAAEEK